jgi:hypothetical protein
MHQDGKHPHLPLFPTVTPKLATKLNFNKTLLLLAMEPLGLQKKVQAWMKYQSGKNPMLAIPNSSY